MRYFALASDYDGTLAHHGKVDEATLSALRRFKESGRKFILVTGRELPELLQIFPQSDLCDMIVAENGALLYRPSSREERVLAKRPPPSYIEFLRSRGVHPLSVGRVIVATFEPHEKAALEGIHTLGLELQIIFNKGAVMILPTGVNKATGLKAALKEMSLSSHNVIGVGDAENDHAFMESCERAVAVANALPALKEKADLVTRAPHGAGVAEVIEELLRDDLRELESTWQPCGVTLGTLPEGEEFILPGSGISILVAGTSVAEQSTWAHNFVKRLRERKYQSCVIDPDGSYPALEGFLPCGATDRPPSAVEVANALQKPSEDVLVQLTGLRLEERPSFFLQLLWRLHELRVRTGRPHWIVASKADQVIPSSEEPSSSVVPLELKNVALITTHPRQVLPSSLKGIDLAIALGRDPRNTLEEFCQAADLQLPFAAPSYLESGKAVGWWRKRDRVFTFNMTPLNPEHRHPAPEHSTGELPPDQSFYFEGPQKKLHLRAQNLQLFLQIGSGVDEDTWIFHLRQHDYSKWFRKQLKDPDLASAVEVIESDATLAASESRKRIHDEIEVRYNARPKIVKLGST
jgi:hydroxymethylpyrimidine pyrophosphatase-like HAD family hydrolase